MKSLLFLCILLPGFFFGNSGDVSAQDTSLVPVTIQRRMSTGDFTPDFAGFRGYRFGRSHFGISGIVQRSVRDRIIWYTVVDHPDIGHAWIKNLGFGFRDDKFYGVMAVPQDYRSYLALKTIVDSVYGAPIVTNRLQTSLTYIWKVQPGVIIKLLYYWGNRGLAGTGNEMLLSFISAPILLGRSYR